ncbi:MAG TPA: isocitrate/isopropylmalate family dehydrogenase [Pirellulaceae bacterium]|nr:isocitrate/isopropylmalate family dehydrogenase [Pirellulaceae bacterium]HMO94095.1 isocitrate/isopropylmalate family dehydrogenase [Pirellulaceae bacterium]HMP71022.1 isocitrate/isopropylmalate family dehydrogenase [Pirellulaceae bacterium]
MAANKHQPEIRKLCVIPGDGIGPEVTEEAVAVLRAVMRDVQIIYAEAGWEVFRRTGSAVPPATLEALRSCGAGLFGAVSSPSQFVPGYKSAILTMRQELNLHANIRPIDARWSETAMDNVRLVIVRENTEDLYVGQETSDGEIAVARRVISRNASKRIARTACEVATRFRKSQIHIVHKANVLPKTDGLFRDAAREAIEEYMTENHRSFEISEGLVDIVAYRLVAQPKQFEVLVTTNMFGDILSDLAAYWCGGMGRAPSLNWGEGIALAEPVHGSAPDIAGKGIADPTAAILSVALLCRLHWNDWRTADRIESLCERKLSASSR